MGVSLALGKTIEEAKEKANRGRDLIQLKS